MKLKSYKSYWCLNLFLELTVSTSVHWHTSVEHDHHWTGKVISLYLNSLSAAAPCEPVAPPPCLSVPSAPSRRQGRFALCSAGSIPQLDVLDLCSGWSQPPHRGLQPPPEPLIHTDRAAATANQQQPSWSPQRYSGRVGLSYIVSKLQLTERAGKTTSVSCLTVWFKASDYSICSLCWWENTSCYRLEEHFNCDALSCSHNCVNTVFINTHTQTNTHRHTLILMLRPSSVTEGYLIKLTEWVQLFLHSVSLVSHYLWCIRLIN